MNDLFPDHGQRAHDPGGSVMTTLPPGMIGDASFYGPGDMFRIWLNRRWDAPGQRKGLPGSMLLIPYVLLIGMNPSTATGQFNDPTISREIGFATEWGFEMLFKGNVCDYRATDQRDLLDLDIQPCSAANHQTLLELANNSHCKKIVLCCGKLHKRILPYRDDLVRMLRRDGHAIECFGLTPTGHPRHPLYLKKGTPLVPWTGDSHA